MLESRKDAMLVLGLAEGFKSSDLKEHYKFLLRVYHPDTTKFSDDTSIALQRVKEAYDLLSGASTSKVSSNSVGFKHSSILRVVRK